MRAIDSDQVEMLILKDFALTFGVGSSSSGSGEAAKPSGPPGPGGKRRLYQSDDLTMALLTVKFSDNSGTL